jgi:hypothetical protein
MLKPALMAAGLLIGGLTLTGPMARAESSSASSLISEVDACNRAQYAMADNGVVQGFRLSSNTDKQGTQFHCKVLWSQAAKAKASDRPILFPNSVSIPVIWSGWF